MKFREVYLHSKGSYSSHDRKEARYGQHDPYFRRIRFALCTHILAAFEIISAIVSRSEYTASLLYITPVIALFINRSFRHASRILRLYVSSDTIIPGFIFGASYYERVSTITKHGYSRYVCLKTRDLCASVCVCVCVCVRDITCMVGR